MKTETILRKLDINNIVNEELNPIEEIEEVFDIYELVFVDKNLKKDWLLHLIQITQHLHIRKIKNLMNNK